MLKNSILGKLYFVVASLLKSFKYSVTYKVLSSVKNFIAKVFKGSMIYKFFATEDKVQDFSKESAILKFADKILVGVVAFFSGIYKKLRNFNEGSVNNLIFNFFHKNLRLSFQTLTALFIVLMVIVPGHKWNNIYGLLFAILLLGLYFFSLLSGKEFSYKVSKFDFLMLVFMVVTAMGVLISHAPKDSFRVFMFFVTSFIFMIVISGSLKTVKELDNFVGIILAGLILTSLYCIYQGLTGVEIDVRLTDLSANQGMPGRAYSTFENPNNYAEYLVMFIPFLFAFALNRKSKIKKAACIILCLIPFVALLYTYSRSCWVSFAIALIVFVCFYNYKLIPLMLLLGVVALPFLPDTILRRISTIGSMKDSSNKYRILIWEGMLRLLKDYCVTGIGLGPETFSKLYPSYATPSAILAPHSHMLFMQVLTETGILGFISFILYWILNLKRLITVKIKYKPSKELKAYICAALASFTGIIFVSGVEYIWFYPRVMISFFILTGLIMSIIKISKQAG